MTLKEIQALQLSISSEGFAFCKPGKDGKMIPVREITDQEITAILAAKYYTHIQAHPDDKVMIIPLDDKGSALAVGYAHIEPKAATVPEASASGTKRKTAAKPKTSAKPKATRKAAKK